MEPSRRTRRPRVMRFVPVLVTLVTLALAVVLAGCAGAGTSTAPTPSAPEVRSAEDAAAAVTARSPIFDGIGRRDPDLIGQGDSWEATPLDAQDPPGGWSVTYELGWGDCPAGCIDRHTWTYEVMRNGTVTFVGEAGSPLTDEVLSVRLGEARITGVGGRVLAGPVCPVEQPGDPSCAARPVAGAVLVIRDATGGEAGRFTTDGSGLYRITLPPGEYAMEAQPVEGLMGTPGPLPFMVRDGVQAALDVPYDTGIR